MVTLKEQHERGMRYGSNVPKARELLEEMVHQLSGGLVVMRRLELAHTIEHDIIPLLHQKPQRAPQASSGISWSQVTETDKWRILEMYNDQHCNYQEIAEVIGVSAGRISEYINGQRT